MLSENIKNIRKAKGLSQEELAIRLNVVRQTVSKWEQGRSVPDADMLISVSEVLETPVSTLLGETVTAPSENELNVLAQRLEEINLQLAKGRRLRWRIIYGALISVAAIIVALFVFFVLLQSRYLSWSSSDPETAVAAAVLHAFEFCFVRIAPFALAGTLAGLILVRRKLS